MHSLFFCVCMVPAVMNAMYESDGEWHVDTHCQLVNDDIFWFGSLAQERPLFENLPIDEGPLVLSEASVLVDPPEKVVEKSVASLALPVKKTHKRVYRRLHLCPFDGCPYVTRYLSNLAVHERIHTGERPFVCDYPGCIYTAINASNLTQHKRCKHMVNDTRLRYPCPQCTYVALQKWLLKIHMRKHTKERPYKCDIAGCGYAAATQSNLSRHCRRVHECA